jgi:hypothetical protein
METDPVPTRLVVALVLLLALPACTGPEPDRGQPSPVSPSPPSPSPAPPATTGWDGPPSAERSGEMEVDPFNTFLQETGAPWTRSPSRIALEYLGLEGVDARRITTVARRMPPSIEGPIRAVIVTVTEDGLVDDSVRAIRYRLLLAPGPNGTWSLQSATAAQRCWPGRGHQRFTPAACV